MTKLQQACSAADCCSDSPPTPAVTLATIDAVREKYAQTARSDLTNQSAGVQAVAEAFGYSAEELLSIPAEANMGLSCGNPLAIAHLRPGEVVVDLGSGGGLDVFLAARKVGLTGKAIGIDMTPDMIARAKNAAERGVNGKPIANVEFHLASIEALPLADASVDVIISNCVINLSNDKPAVFREMMRVLKPGGRVAVSDIALKKTLPTEIASDVMAYVGCIAGAIEISAYERGLRDAGFHGVAVVDAKADLNAYGLVEGQVACCAPTSSADKPASSEASCCAGVSGHDSESMVHQHLSDLMKKHDINQYAASVRIFALKSIAN